MGQHLLTDDDNDDGDECTDCTVHAGFLYAWSQTRELILPHLDDLFKKHPAYKLVLVGHSLGGAVAALAALEIRHRRPDWNLSVTTFGEPRIGNEAFVNYFDAKLIYNNVTNANKEDGWKRITGEGQTHERETQGSTADVDKDLEDDDQECDTSVTYRRVTHKGDPVPLLPLEVLSYRMHAGEIYIDQRDLPPAVVDIYHCHGDEDQHCIAGSNTSSWFPSIHPEGNEGECTDQGDDENESSTTSLWIPLSSTSEKGGEGEEEEGDDDDDDDDNDDGENDEYSSQTIIQPTIPLPVPPTVPVPIPGHLILAHRDYFWRLGLCIPGGDPSGRHPSSSSFSSSSSSPSSPSPLSSSSSSSSSR